MHVSIGRYTSECTYVCTHVRSHAWHGRGCKMSLSHQLRSLREVVTATTDLPWGILISRFQLVLKALSTEDITSVLVVVPHRVLFTHIALPEGGGGRGRSH